VRARWWAPTRATIDPDAVTLALLTPDGDPAGDLGATLLGFHRAGAASCEAVAKGPIPSETSLMTALDLTNSFLAKALTSAISKSLEGNYAGLLIRDVRADADESALALFRTCVNKGVSPPVAASRVGAVYGVPSRDLGKYPLLAADPKANQLALTDAADRALLGYVAKMVATEIPADGLQDISKAAPVQERTRFDPREHARAVDTGRFVSMADTATDTKAPVSLSPLDRLRAKLGLGRPAPSQVGEETEVEEQDEDDEDDESVEVDRGNEVDRAAPIETPTGTLVPTQALSATQTLSATGLESTSLLAATTMMDIRAALGQTNTDPPDPADSGSSDKVNPAMRTFTQGGGYGILDQEDLVFTLTQNTGRGLLRNMAGAGTADSPRMFRIGHLVNASGKGPEVLVDPDHPDFDDLQQAAGEERTTVADTVKADIEGYSQPAVSTQVSYIDVNPQDAEQIAELKSVMQRFAYKNGYTSDEANRREVQNNIAYVNDYDTDRRVLVHILPRDRGQATDVDSPDRPKPVIDEFVLKPGRGMHDVRGNRLDTGGDRDTSPHWEFDQNQIFVVTVDEKGRNFTELWDDTNSVFVHRYFVTPIDPDDEAAVGTIYKALATVAQELDFERVHPRDTSGQFATKTSAARPSLVAPSALTPMVARLRDRLRAGQTVLEPPVAEIDDEDDEDEDESGLVDRGDDGLVDRRSEPARGTLRATGAMLPGATAMSHTTLEADPRLEAVGMALDSRLIADPNSEIQFSPESRFKVFSGADWSEIEGYIGEDYVPELLTEGGTAPLNSFVRRLILNNTDGNIDLLTGFRGARDQIATRARDELNTPDNDDQPERNVGKPFLIPAGDPENRSMAILGHQMAEVLNEHPEYDRITAVIDDRTGGGSTLSTGAEALNDIGVGTKVVQLIGNSRPVKTQIILEFDPDLIDPAQLSHVPLELVNVGQRRGKDISTTLRGGRVSMVGRDWRETISAYNVRVQVFRVQPRSQ
jgi:hypothetical protein